MNKEPKVSVVIPAYNEEKYIENSLFSLLKSEQKTNIDYEVVLVDNNSTDKTVELAQKFKSGMNLRIVHEQKVGRGAARAKGFNEAIGDIILSADADTIFYEDWIETLVSEIKIDVVAVTTPCKILDCSPITNLIFNILHPKIMFLYKLFLGHYWLSGFSFGISKSIYVKAGGFDTKLQTLEDLDLSFRVAKLGKIKFIKKAVIFSGRRFKNGLISGFYDYLHTFIQGFILKKKNIYLDNLR